MSEIVSVYQPDGAEREVIKGLIGGAIMQFAASGKTPEEYMVSIGLMDYDPKYYLLAVENEFFRAGGQ